MTELIYNTETKLLTYNHTWRCAMEMPAQNMVEIVDLSPADALLPIIECVSNSIISLSQNSLPIEERNITVEIVRNEEWGDNIFSGVKPIKDVVITDNGIGFTEKNFLSFKTPHSNILRKYGCLGVGRFTVLAAFQDMKICSNFRENGGWKYREFNFHAVREIESIAYEDSNEKSSKTTVALKNCFNDAILDRTAVTVTDIATTIMKNFLIYYLSDNLPNITVMESDRSATQNVNELYKTVSKDNERSFKVLNQDFKVYITRSPKTTNRKNHYIHYCADSRTVGEPKRLGVIDSIFFYPLSKKMNESYLDVYVVSSYLDKMKLNTRNGFKIPEEQENNLFGEVISFQDIENELVTILKEEYSDHVKQTQEINKSEWKAYISHNPRYNSILNDEKVLNSLPANTPDEKKEEHLHHIIYTRQKKVEKRIQEFIETQQISEASIQALIEDFRTKTVLDSDSLTDYMLRRRAVIDLFEKFLEADKNGKYPLESDVHNLIFPVRTTSNEIDYESHNLWLLDERLVSYSFIASDKAISSYSDIKSRKEADLACLNHAQIFDNPIGFGDKNYGDISTLVIFEFKRPGDTASNKGNNNRWEYSDLTDKYFDAFMYGDRKTNYQGRIVNVREHTPKFGYVILDSVPQELEKYNELKGWTRTPFDSFYKMTPANNLHLEVMTFTTLIEFAKQRHNPFFNRLFVA